MPKTLYFYSILGIPFLAVIIFVLARRKRAFSTFTNYELITLSLFICLLFVSRLPMRIGLGFGNVLLLNGIIMFAPYIAVLVIGIRLVPKVGSVFLMTIGYGILSTFIYGGNFLILPYYFLTSFVLELYFLVTGDYVKSLVNTMIGSWLIAVIGGTFFFCVSAPLFYRLHYAPWFIIIRVIFGNGVGALVGAYIGYKVGGVIEKSFKGGI